ncbi:MAG: PspC domain-containing protein [Verrucomicrobiales bacterium]|nr:PspC domain-containing protein [Verrucomicrobiales bacterium]
MVCTNCGKQIAEYSNFCYFCGSRQEAGSAAPPARPGLGDRRLYRSTTNRSVAGVLGGFAEYLDIDPTLLRVIYVLVTFFTGIVPGVFAYLVAWIVMSEAPEGSAAYASAGAAFESVRKRLTRSATNRKWAGVCGGLGEYLDVDPTVIRIIWVVLTVVPGAILGGLLVYLLAWMVMPEGPRPALASQASSEPVPHSS